MLQRTMLPIHEHDTGMTDIQSGAQSQASSYGATFYDRLASGTTRSAEVIISHVVELLNPTSLVDVGCGDGRWLQVCQAKGIHDVLGIEGPWVKQSSFAVDPAHLLHCNLAQSTPTVERTFNIAISMEVAEHLPESRAADFVAFLTSLSDVVLFSAAIPGQGGTDHVNEQWQSYWAEQFSHYGFEVLDALRPLIWSDSQVDVWYRQNALLFVRQRTELNHAYLQGLPRGDNYKGPLSIVHPDLFSFKIRRTLSKDGIARLFKRLRNVVSKSAAYVTSHTSHKSN